MGFWHTGVMDHLEQYVQDPFDTGRPYKPMAKVHICSKCGRDFGSEDDLAVHNFDGHPTSRPRMMLRGRECARSRSSVIDRSDPADWSFLDCRFIAVNGQEMDPSTAAEFLSKADRGVVSVTLAGDAADQRFEFSFAIADPVDIDGVDQKLYEMIKGRKLTIDSIEAFLDAAQAHESAHRYRDGIANYLYGVLAREGSSESGLLHQSNGDRPAYLEKYDEAVVLLGDFDRAPAEAICGLVAFHYNQFDDALRRTRSPRVARASRRLAVLLGGGVPDEDETVLPDNVSIDYLLSDALTERVLRWCCTPLDGSSVAAETVAELEDGLAAQEPADQLKLRLIAAEHYLRAGETEQGRAHYRELRHNSVVAKWADLYGTRLEELEQE